jgi:hypothetical protein
MTTFDVTDWCDFVRGVAAPETERDMRERLAAGDAGARGTVDFLARVMAVARIDQETQVPEHAVRSAQAIAAVTRAAATKDCSPPAVEGSGEATLWHFLPAAIAFDSFLEPAVGTRDLFPAFRQLSFQAEGFTVDVRLEADAGPRGTAVVVGQVLATGAEVRPVVRVPVLFTAGGKIVGRSVTSRFGEFQAEELPRERLELYVLVGPETCVAVPLEQAADY